MPKIERTLKNHQDSDVDLIALNKRFNAWLTSHPQSVELDIDAVLYYRNDEWGTWELSVYYYTTE